MPKDHRTTRAWRRLVTQCQQTHPWICHLCGNPIPRGLPPTHPLAYQADHLLPYLTHPWLRMQLANLRPAHRTCNIARKARPLTPQLRAQLRARYTRKYRILPYFQPVAPRNHIVVQGNDF